jgi:hypothetical protein
VSGGDSSPGRAGEGRQQFSNTIRVVHGVVVWCKGKRKREANGGRDQTTLDARGAERAAAAARARRRDEAKVDFLATDDLL